MSLIKQLWIAVALVMALAFGASTAVNVLSARHYLEQQLQVKNIDNATALALSLSQLPKDPVTIELQVAAQFDVGHYRFIRIVSPTGQTLVERQFNDRLPGAPRWFTELIPIRAVPGQAQIQDGWKQYGTLTLASHEQYAYNSLWDGLVWLLLWFVPGAVITGCIGTLGVRYVTRPLAEVVAQAEAIAQRRFRSIAEPRTPELRSLVRAMNSMTERLRAMFNEEAARLDALRQKVNCDALTGMAGREHFLSQLQELLSGEGAGAEGTLVLLRLTDLNAMNDKLGHPGTDQLIAQLGHVLREHCQEHTGQQVGRLAAGDFSVVCPTLCSPAQTAIELHKRLHQQWLPNWVTEVPDLFHLAAVSYHRDQPIGDLLSNADEALVVAETQSSNSWYASSSDGSHVARSATQWHGLLTEAVAHQQLRLVFYRVLARGGQSDLHQEGMVRLQAGSAGTLLPAGDFMPMADHLHLTAPIDLMVVKLALDHLRAAGGKVAINLSAKTIVDFGFRHELMQLLEAQRNLCQRLSLEVSEYGVFRQFDAFCDLAHSVKPLGCHVGIDYFGQRFVEAGKLTELGLDYIKVHPSYVHGIADNRGNQEFLSGLCKATHHFGIVVIAAGVRDAGDLPLLDSLGFDGATGPGVA